MKKKTKIMILSVVALILVTIGITYAYWLVTKSQAGENTISSGCLDITLEGQNDITLSNQFPMSDADGIKLTPYEFTVTNNCSTSVDYQIALEALGDASTALSDSALKVALNDDVRLYNAFNNGNTTLDDAYESRILNYTRLSSKGSEGDTDSYSLRIWIDADASIDEMNKTFRSKITVTTGQGYSTVFEEGTLAYNILSQAGGAGANNDTDTGIFKTVDDLGDTYYFKGDVKNNYFLFGGNDNVEVTIDNFYYFSFAEKGATFEYGYCFDADGIDCYYGDEFTSLEACENDAQSKGVPAGQCYLNDNYYWLDSYADDGFLTQSYEECESYRKSDYFKNNYGETTECQLSGYPATDYRQEPMVWRLSRINGDGTLRLIYDGYGLVENGVKHEMWATTITNEQVIFDYAEDPAKTAIESWYTNNLEAKYGKYIADGIFCNEKTDYVVEMWNGDQEAKVYGVNTPGFTCLSKNDRFTVNDTVNGNGLLTKPIGIINIDDINYGSDYLVTENSSDVRTMSPSTDWDGCQDMYKGNGSSGGACDVVGTYLRPVINLRADIEFTGNGTIDSPYKIATE